MEDPKNQFGKQVQLSYDALEEIKSLPGNLTCVDCGSFETEWASVSHGTLLCLSCAGKHRNLGVHTSFVRSLYMDKWAPIQLEVMRQGGNEALLSYLEAGGDLTLPPVTFLGSPPGSPDPVRRSGGTEGAGMSSSLSSTTSTSSTAIVAGTSLSPSFSSISSPTPGSSSVRSSGAGGKRIAEVYSTPRAAEYRDYLKGLAVVALEEALHFEASGKDGDASDPSTPRGKLRLTLTETLDHTERIDSTDPVDVLKRTYSGASNGSQDSLPDDTIAALGSMSLRSSEGHAEGESLPSPPHSPSAGASGADALHFAPLRLTPKVDTQYKEGGDAEFVAGLRESGVLNGAHMDLPHIDTSATTTMLDQYLVSSPSATASPSRSLSETSLHLLGRSDSHDSACSNGDGTDDGSTGGRRSGRSTPSDGHTPSPKHVARDYRVAFSSTPLGLTLTRDHLGGAVVTKVVPDSQASRGGVGCGDVVIGVNSEWMPHYEALMTRLKSNSVFPITLVIRSRSAVAAQLDLELCRAVSSGTLLGHAEFGGGVSTSLDSSLREHRTQQQQKQRGS